MRTPGSTPQERLISTLAEEIAAGNVTILERAEDEVYWKLIRRSFPINRFPYRGASICRLLSDAPVGGDPAASELAWVRDFLTEVSKAAELRSADRLVVLWDSSGNRSMSMSFGLIERYIDDLLWLPSHMYVLPASGDWAICFRMEGDMGFGYRPD